MERELQGGGGDGVILVVVVLRREESNECSSIVLVGLHAREILIFVQFRHHRFERFQFGSTEQVPLEKNIIRRRRLRVNTKKRRNGFLQHGIRRDNRIPQRRRR